MKLLLLLFVVTFGQFCRAAVGEKNLTVQLNEVKKDFYKVIKKACYENSTENYEKFIETTENATKCMEAVMGQTSLFLTSLHTFKSNIQNCCNNFIDELDSCLPETSKNWPQLNFDVFYSFLDYLHENKEELFTPEVASFVKNCSEAFSQNDTSDSTQCFKLLLTTTTETKAFCREMIEFERCMVIELNRKCPAPESIEKLKDGLLSALREPCAEYDVTDDPMDNVFTLMAPYEPPNINPDLI